MNFTPKEKNVNIIADKSTKIKNGPQKKEVKSLSNFDLDLKISTSDNPENKSSKNSQNKNKELKFFGVSEYYIKEISE